MKKLAGCMCLGIGAMALCGNVMYNIALKAHGNKSIVFKASENKVENNPMMSFDPSTIQVKDAWTASKLDGLTLHGSILEKDTSTWVIAMHLYSIENGLLMYTKTSGFLDRGYSMLYPDMRGHGQSAGTYIGMGWHDRFDVLSWIEYLNEKYDNPNIILYGISMGASAVMMTAGEDLPENVKCIVEDCGYVSVKEEMKHEAKALFHIPYYPLVWAGSMITKLRANWTLEEATAIPSLKKAKVPIMFIHGEEDTFVPTWNVYEAYRACTSEKELLLIPGASHTLCQEQDPQTYWSRVLEFTDKFID